MSNDNPFGNPNGNNNSNDGEFSVDLSGAGEGGGDRFLVQEGKHPCKVTDLVRETSKSGNPMFVWDFTVTAGPDAGKDLRLWTVLTPAALWKLKQVAEALDLPVDNGKTDFSKAVGRRCVVVNEHGDYNGRKVNRVQEVEAHPDGPTSL